MKKKIQKAITANHEQQQIQQEDRATPYFENVARITSTLLAALLVLLTFLLVVGAQNSVKGFSGSLYTAIAVLGASLVLYALGYTLREFYLTMLARSSDSQEAIKQQKGKLLAARLLKGIRILQQLVFMASIGAVVWFAITYAQLFLNPTPAAQPQPTSSQQSAPGGSPSPSDAGPSPGETAEQHAKESQPTQP